MDHFIDIRLRRDPEFTASTLMNALFSKLHRALAESQQHNIGVSFPDMRSSQPRLGNVLRLHGECGVLNWLMQTTWLIGMYDHVAIDDVQRIPDKIVQYRVVRRVQAKSNPERLRRRLIRRHQLTEEQAHERIPDTAFEKLNLPYVAVKSWSTGQSFLLFIEQGVLRDHPEDGSFSSYGLSATATVPWF